MKLPRPCCVTPQQEARDEYLPKGLHIWIPGTDHSRRERNTHHWKPSAHLDMRLTRPCRCPDQYWKDCSQRQRRPQLRANGPHTPMKARKNPWVLAVPTVLLIYSLQAAISSTGPLVSAVRNVKGTTILEPTWRSWIAPPWMQERAWQEASTASDGTLPVSAHIKDQYMCHWVFARPIWPIQRTWGLDSYRPDVGPIATILKACNP